MADKKILVFGTILEGYSFAGPFETHEEIDAYLEANPGIKSFGPSLAPITSPPTPGPDLTTLMIMFDHDARVNTVEALFKACARLNTALEGIGLTTLTSGPRPTPQERAVIRAALEVNTFLRVLKNERRCSDCETKVATVRCSRCKAWVCGDHAVNTTCRECSQSIDPTQR